MSKHRICADQYSGKIHCIRENTVARQSEANTDEKQQQVWPHNRGIPEIQFHVFLLMF